MGREKKGAHIQKHKGKRVFNTGWTVPNLKSNHPIAVTRDNDETGLSSTSRGRRDQRLLAQAKAAGSKQRVQRGCD